MTTRWPSPNASIVTIEFDNDALPEFPIPAEFAGATHKEGANRLLARTDLRGRA